MDCTTLLPDRLLSLAFNWLDLNSLVLSSHVSQRWRSLARDHPSYWQHVEFVDSDEYDGSKSRLSVHKVARFQDQLRQGGLRRISVKVDIDFGCTDVETDVFDHINRHLDRVYSLTLHIPDVTFIDEFGALSKPALVLHSLHIWLYPLDVDASNGHEIPPNLFGGHAPKLSRIIIQDVDVMPTQPRVPAFQNIHHVHYFAIEKEAEYPAANVYDIASLFPNCSHLLWAVGDVPIRDDAPKSLTKQQRNTFKAPYSVTLRADIVNASALGGFPLTESSSFSVTATDIDRACLRDLLHVRRASEKVYLIIDRKKVDDTRLTFYADGRSRAAQITLVEQLYPLPILKPHIDWNRVYTLRTTLSDHCWKFFVELCDASLPAVKRLFITLRGKIPAISRLKAISQPLRSPALEHVFFEPAGGETRKLRQSWLQSFVTTHLRPGDAVHLVIGIGIEVKVDLPGATNEKEGWTKNEVLAVSRIHVL